jgi:diguanylate cyclase (GGDEF)-like protein
MFLDLDNFKPLNDLWGHALGDQLLIEVAERIRSSVREVDTVGRFGGDEFVVILNELDSDKTISTNMAFIVADKIRLTITKPFLLKFKEEGHADIDVEHQCTSSIGMTFFIGHAETMEKLLKHADSAMYRAKDAGRNSIRIYSNE